MKRMLKILGLVSVAAAGVATYFRTQAAEHEENKFLVVNDHSVCRQLNQAMDRFEERFGT